MGARMCMPHWDALRAAIDARGLSSMVAGDGVELGRRIEREITTGEQTSDSFDPLMGANIAILNNAMGVLERAGVNPLELMMGEGEHCPICVLNEGHKRACTEDGCTFSYDNWIDHAADDMLAAARGMIEDS